jgi:Flp pilus assembly protein TadG
MSASVHARKWCRRLEISTAGLWRGLSRRGGSAVTGGSRPSSRAYFVSGRGNVAIMSALLMVPFVGGLSLAGDLATAFLANRSMQNAADSAAIAAATNGDVADKDGGSPALYMYQREALAVAAKYGFTNGVGNVTVATTTVTNAQNANCPSSVTQCFQVTVSKLIPLYFSAIVGYRGNATLNGGPALKISSTAIATPYRGASDACVLALDPTHTQTASADVTGGATVLQNCSMQVDSSDPAAFVMTGGSLTAQAVDVVGGYSRSGGTLTATLNTYVASVADPFSGLYSANDVSTLTDESCPQANKNVNISQSTTLSQGVYCGGLNVSSGTVTFSPGVYIIQGGKLQVSGGSASGTGVTFILTCGSPPCSSSSNNWATAQLTGGTSNFSAPTSGVWSGMLFYQDYNDTAGNNDKDSLTGGANTLEGALYFPTQPLTYTGGAAAAPCTEIVAWTVTFTGGGTIGYSCAGAGVAVIGNGGVKLALVQ